jgi:hypothetical protein
LHGAGVEAINQALSYSHKNWGYIICPTNRRSYGFNWENWGRIDALEVLDITEKEFNAAKERIVLIGCQCLTFLHIMQVQEVIKSK